MGVGARDRGSGGQRVLRIAGDEGEALELSFRRGGVGEVERERAVDRDGLVERGLADDGGFGVDRDGLAVAIGEGDVAADNLDRAVIRDSGDGRAESRERVVTNGGAFEDDRAGFDGGPGAVDIREGRGGRGRRDRTNSLDHESEVVVLGDAERVGEVADGDGFSANCQRVVAERNIAVERGGVGGEQPWPEGSTRLKPDIHRKHQVM